MKLKPNTIDEAVRIIINSDGVNRLKKCGSTSFHHTTGRAIRNDWGLWDPNSTLNNSFKAIGIFHPDDMSGIILESAYRILKGLPVNLRGQVKRYNKYWKDLREKGVVDLNDLMEKGDANLNDD